MCIGHCLDSLGSGDNAHEVNVLASLVLEHLDSGYCGSAGSQHGIYNEYLSLIAVCRKLAIIFNGFVSFGITIKSDVTYLCGGDQIEHTVNHSKTCS